MSRLLSRVRGTLVLLAVLATLAPSLALAANDVKKLVIHVPQDDPQSMVQALNMANGVMNALGQGFVDIEIVAQGPGLKLITTKSEQPERVASLVAQGVKFSACGNTMRAIAKKTGKEPQLLPGVGRVPAGVVRVMELEEQGYAYVRP